MSRDDGKAEALHLATYSGWYRFEQRDQQWVQTDKALTFLEDELAPGRSGKPEPHLYRY